MAVPTMGISFVALATDCAEGVAMAQIRSTLLLTNRLAMFCRLDWSAWAFCRSKVIFFPSVKPFLANPSTKPLLAASSAACSTSCTIPTLNFFSAFGAGFLSPPPQPAIPTASVSIRAAVNAFILEPDNLNIFPHFLPSFFVQLKAKKVMHFHVCVLLITIHPIL